MSATRADRPPVGRLALFFALLGGPIAWTAHLLISYPLVPVACDMGTNAILNAVTAATALLSAAAALVGWWAYRRLRGDPPFDWARFMAVSGALLGAFFVFVIVVEGLPPLLQDACLENL